MCLYPTIIENRKYKPNKKNGGQPPPLSDPRCKYVPIGCQQCLECKKQKAREWQVRLTEEIKHSTNAKCITLTFSNESIKQLSEYLDWEEDQTPAGRTEGYQRDNRIATLATRRFLERWRKTYKKSLKHWFVTELGHEGTENIHIHGIIWTDHCIEKDKYGLTLEEIKQHWQYGFIYNGKIERGKRINYVNERTVNYITKYVNKLDKDHTAYNTKILTSKGIGNQYTKTTDAQRHHFREDKTIETYTTRTGYKLPLPIYYRNKLYSEKQRELLWIHKLNKQIRYVRGEKISIKNGEAAYFQLLKWHQERNKELGYGCGQITWTEREYQKQRRNLLRTQRIKNIKEPAAIG